VISRKTWREARWMTLVYTLILMVLLIPAILLWDDLYDDLQRGSAILKTFTSFFKEAFEGMRDPNEIIAFRNYMAVQMFFKGSNVAGIACAILLGTGLIARERENHTLEFLLARRVSRSAILWRKFWVVALCVSVPVYVTSWAALPIVASIDQELTFAAVTQAATHASLFLILILALCTVFSTFCRYQVHVAFWIGGIVIVNVSLFFVPIFKDYNLIKLSDWGVYNPILVGNMSWGTMFMDYTLWVLLGTVACYVVADQIFRRTDL